MIIFNIVNWKILILTLHHLFILPVYEMYFDKSPVLIMVMTTLIAQITGQHPAFSCHFSTMKEKNSYYICILKRIDFEDNHKI